MLYMCLAMQKKDVVWNVFHFENEYLIHSSSCTFMKKKKKKKYWRRMHCDAFENPNSEFEIRNLSIILCLQNKLN